MVYIIKQHQICYRTSLRWSIAIKLSKVLSLFLSCSAFWALHHDIQLHHSFFWFDFLCWFNPFGGGGNPKIQFLLKLVPLSLKLLVQKHIQYSQLGGEVSAVLKDHKYQSKSYCIVQTQGCLFSRAMAESICQVLLLNCLSWIMWTLVPVYSY